MLNESVCIRTFSSTGKGSVYLSPILQSSSVDLEVVSVLLQVKCTVKIWSTLLSKFYDLSIRDIMTLIMKVDDLSINKVDYVTPHKRRDVVKNKVELNTVDELPDVNLFDSVSLPLTGLDMQPLLQDLCKQVFALSLATGSLSSGITLNNNIIESSLSSLRDPTQSLSR